jgi:hypothetical protein
LQCTYINLLIYITLSPYATNGHRLKSKKQSSWLSGAFKILPLLRMDIFSLLNFTDGHIYSLVTPTMVLVARVMPKTYLVS